MVARLSDLGYTAQKLPGPLLLATTGGNRQVPKLMPTFMLFRTLFDLILLRIALRLHFLVLKPVAR